MISSGMAEIVDPKLIEQADRALVAFLRAELQLGFTYAGTTKVEAGFDPKGEQRARKLATDALETIVRFLPRISDPAIQEDLRKGSMELEQSIAEFQARRLSLSAKLKVPSHLRCWPS